MGYNKRKLTQYEKNMYIELYFYIKEQNFNNKLLPVLSNSQIIKVCDQINIFYRHSRNTNRIRGMVIGKNIFLSRDIEPELKFIDRQLLSHEFIHTYQFLNKWNMCRILWQWIRYQKRCYHTYGCLEYDAVLLSSMYVLNCP